LVIDDTLTLAWDMTGWRCGCLRSLVLMATLLATGTVFRQKVTNTRRVLLGLQFGARLASYGDATSWSSRIIKQHTLGPIRSNVSAS
jgi:hypothetical protein